MPLLNTPLDTNKTDPIGKISWNFSPEELGSCHRVLLEIKRQNVVYDWWIEQILKIVQDAIKLRVEGVIYMFHIEDSIAVNNLWNWEGISIYRRTWNTLTANYNEDDVPKIEKAIDLLIERNVNKVVTWPIIGDFLWLSWNQSDDRNKKWESYPDLIDIIIRSQLDDIEIKALNDAWIEVTIQNPLI